MLDIYEKANNFRYVGTYSGVSVNRNRDRNRKLNSPGDV